MQIIKFLKEGLANFGLFFANESLGNIRPTLAISHSIEKKF